MFKQFSKKAKEELSKESVKDRLSYNTTSPFWSRIRAISGTIGAGLGIAAPNLQGKEKIACYVLSGILMSISARAHLDKSNKSLKK